MALSRLAEVTARLVMYMLSAVPFFSTSASASRFSTSARVKVPTWISACNTSMMAAFSSSICAQSITAV